MLKSGVHVQPNVLVAGSDPLLEALSKQLVSADVKVIPVATAHAVEKVWMAAPQIVVAIGDAVVDGGDALRDALLSEPASADIPLLLIRRGRSSRDFKGTATIAPILGANRIGRVIARIAQEFLETPRAADAQPLQRHISATLHCVEREVTFSGTQTSPLISQTKQRRTAQASSPRRSHTQLSMAPPPVTSTNGVANGAEGGPQRGLVWTTPPNSISSQNLVAAQVPAFEPIPAHTPHRQVDSSGMDPNFGQSRVPQVPPHAPRGGSLGGDGSGFNRAEPDLEQTYSGMGHADLGAADGQARQKHQETPTLRPEPIPTAAADNLITDALVANAIPTKPPAAAAPDAWEAEDAFADLGEELGTERKSGPAIEPSGMRVLKNGAQPGAARLHKAKSSVGGMG